jgi:hypothetical protein
LIAPRRRFVSRDLINISVAPTEIPGSKQFRGPFNFRERLSRESILSLWRQPEYLAHSPRALFRVETFATETPLRPRLFQ